MCLIGCNELRDWHRAKQYETEGRETERGSAERQKKTIYDTSVCTLNIHTIRCISAAAHVSLFSFVYFECHVPFEYYESTHNED